MKNPVLQKKEPANDYNKGNATAYRERNGDGVNAMTMLVDRFGRRINYLRVSVTDRCNMRCVYCVPPDVTFLPPGEILTLEEIGRVVRVGVEQGIEKVRLTGGEPLARKNVIKLVRDLGALDGLAELSLTTNGLLLEEFAAPLREAGLDRVNVSLDTLRPGRFKGICRLGELDRVLAGIAAASRAGLDPVKVNVVAMRGVNDDEFPEFVRFGIENNVTVRFIEYMPVASNPEWEQRYIPRDEILERIRDYLDPDATPVTGLHDPARYYPLRGGGMIGIISAVSHKFCSSCNRLRLTSDGKLRSCLLNEDSIDLKMVLRNNGNDYLVGRAFSYAVAHKRECGKFQDICTCMNEIGG